MPGKKLRITGSQTKPHTTKLYSSSKV